MYSSLQFEHWKLIFFQKGFFFVTMHVFIPMYLVSCVGVVNIADSYDKGRH